MFFFNVSPKIHLLFSILQINRVFIYEYNLLFNSNYYFFYFNRHAFRPFGALLILSYLVYYSVGVRRLKFEFFH